MSEIATSVWDIEDYDYFRIFCGEDLILTGRKAKDDKDESGANRKIDSTLTSMLSVNPNITTYRGIGVGMSEEALLEAYPELGSVDTGSYDQDELLEDLYRAVSPNGNNLMKVLDDTPDYGYVFAPDDLGQQNHCLLAEKRRNQRYLYRRRHRRAALLATAGRKQVKRAGIRRMNMNYLSLSMIISSSVLILVIAALRRLLRGKISSRVQYALWLLVALRLLIPFDIGNLDFSVSSVTAAGGFEQRLERVTLPAPSYPASTAEPDAQEAAIPTGEPRKC